jgi:DNA-binding GntR family transcriptional regulator
MTRHQALELLITRRIPDDVSAIEATLRAIASRIDAADGPDQYAEVHQRLDDLLVARERATAAAPSHVVLV